MKKIFYTQRVEIIKEYGERRDCADQRLPEFLLACGYCPVAVPNLSKYITGLAEQLQPDGIFFTGGNNLVKYGGEAPERDETEKLLTGWAVSHNVPIFGICRGMQFLTDFFGGHIEPVEGHVGIRHTVEGDISRESVNSYHTFAIWSLPEPLTALSWAPDGSIEAFCHKSYQIMAVSWHPERELNFSERDIQMVCNFFE